jgi:hypothetical protein
VEGEGGGFTTCGALSTTRESVVVEGFSASRVGDGGTGFGGNGFVSTTRFSVGAGAGGGELSRFGEVVGGELGTGFSSCFGAVAAAPSRIARSLSSLLVVGDFVVADVSGDFASAVAAGAGSGTLLTPAGGGCTTSGDFVSAARGTG